MASDAVFGEVPPGALWASGLTPRVWGVFQSRGGALAASEDDARLQVTDDSGGVREPAPSAQVALPRQLRAALAPLVGRQASRWSRGCRGDRAGRVGGAEPSGSPAAARVSGLELGGSGSPGCARGRRVLGQREVAVAPRGESGEPGTRRLSARPPESSGGELHSPGLRAPLSQPRWTDCGRAVALGGPYCPESAESPARASVASTRSRADGGRAPRGPGMTCRGSPLAPLLFLSLHGE